MLPDMLKRFMDLWFWWLPKAEKEAERAEKSESDESASPAESSRAPVDAGTAQDDDQPAVTTSPPAASTDQYGQSGPSSREADDLTAIKGIGPAMQDKMRKLGISTFADLAETDPGELTASLKSDGGVISRARVEAWITAARDVN
ncbi:MAG: helix-hairpin-helix domain-containing protein, partial [Aquisalimonadaceae bacterium]